MSEHLELKPEFKSKSIRSYVIRGGRMTEGQRNAFDHAWAQYGLSLFNGVINPRQLFGREAPLVVEVGFGMGDSLLAMAKAQPHCDFIGIEVHPPGVGRLLNNAAKNGVTNLRVYMADAIDVLKDCFVDNSIDRFQLYFPDPWHKKKHCKRRIVQPDFIQLLYSKLATGGICHMATDWGPYAEHMMEIMSASEGFSNCNGTNAYAPRPDYRPLTKFEQRGKHLGHKVWDLLFKRH